MRINLNFKDSTITRLSVSEYRIVFDISKMIKPRISSDARMYIEHFNLPEFIDDKWGKYTGELNGYFELRCENIDNNDYDSEFGNTGNAVIFSSPLNNYAKFSNNDPMFISNFKISQNFLRDRLVFTLRIFDKNGDPFVTSSNVTHTVDENSNEYKAYIAKVNELNILNDNLEEAKNISDTLKNEIEQKTIRHGLLLTNYTDAREVLRKKMDDVLVPRTGPRPLGRWFKTEVLKELLNVPSINSFVYLFEVFLTNALYTKEPYSLYDTELQDFYTAYIELKSNEFEIDQLKINNTDINSFDQGIWYDIDSVFDPKNVPINALDKQDLDYTVSVGAKSGKIDLSVFNSLSSRTSNGAYTIVKKIKPATGDLVANDVLEIAETEFTSSMTNTFKYAIVKDLEGKPAALSFFKDDGSGLSTAEDKLVRFSVVVERTGNQYSHKFIDSGDPDYQSAVLRQGMNKNWKIKILGSALGGVDGVNDYEITIDAIHVPKTTESYPITGYTDPAHTGKGSIDVNVQRDNTKGDYTVLTFDLTNSKDFTIGDILTIQGSKLGGEDGTNDATIRVDAIISDRTRDLSFNQTEPGVSHKMQRTTINQDKATVQDSAGNTQTDRIFEIYVDSDNEKYNVEIVTSTTENFAVGDKITILGDNLGGATGTNDLIIVVNSLVDGKVETLTIDPSTENNARNPNYSFTVVVPNFDGVNENKYTIESLESTELKTGDQIIILGSILGGADPLNNCGFVIGNVTPATGSATTDTIEIDTTVGVVGIPKLLGNKGEITSATITGKAYQEPFIGTWEAKQTTGRGTAAQASATAPPKLKITLKKVVNGILKLGNDITTKEAEVLTLKSTIPETKRRYLTDLNSQQNKLKAMNMSLVLYDEVPEYTQASSDAIKGNTYSRYNGCQFKRI